MPSFYLIYVNVSHISDTVRYHSNSNKNNACCAYAYKYICRYMYNTSCCRCRRHSIAAQLFSIYCCCAAFVNSPLATAVWLSVLSPGALSFAISPSHTLSYAQLLLIIILNRQLSFVLILWFQFASARALHFIFVVFSFDFCFAFAIYYYVFVVIVAAAVSWNFLGCATRAIFRRSRNLSSAEFARV